MNYLGIDLHKVHSQLCVVDERGVVVEEIRIHTKVERFVEVLGGRPPLRALIESSGMCEWLARIIEGLGHEVIVADPGYALMYGARNPKMKTDLRDANALAQACRLGIFRRAHRSSDEAMRVRRRLAVRRNLVSARTRFVTMARGSLRWLGIMVPTGSTEKFPERMAATELPGHARSELGPLLAALRGINSQIEYSDAVIERMAQQNESMKVLMTMPGIGPITAAAFASLVGDATRFKNAHQVEAYLGLVPREHSSGELTRRGSITRNGNSYVRSLLVQSAVRLMRMKPPAAGDLVAWAEKIAARRGKNVARVALARRLTGVLFAMMRDQRPFLPFARKEAVAA